MAMICNIDGKEAQEYQKNTTTKFQTKKRRFFFITQKNACVLIPKKVEFQRDQ